MSSIIRKALWPAALIGALAVFFGAMGTGNVQTTYAAVGDVCSIKTAKVGGVELLGGANVLEMNVGDTKDIYAFFENTGADHRVDVNLDTGTAVAWITSIDLDADGDTESVPATRHRNEVAATIAANICGAAAAPGTPGTPATPAVTILSVVLADIQACIALPQSNPASCHENWGHQNIVDAGGVNAIAGHIATGLASGIASCATLETSVQTFLQGLGVNQGVRNNVAADVRMLCEDDDDAWLDLEDVPATPATPGTPAVLEDSVIGIDVTCEASGVFTVSFAPETQGAAASIDVVCGGQAETATIVASPTVVETVPAETLPGATPNLGRSNITVTVMDRHGMRVDGAKVTFTTDNCRFINHADGSPLFSPAGGNVRTVTTYSNTLGALDTQFVTNNPLETQAGTARVVLNCELPSPLVSPGPANITAIVERPGADIVLNTTVQVIGQTAATGLTVTVTPDANFKCGEPVLATARAVDVNGNPVSNGTVIHFTTITSSGVVGGHEGAQGQAPTVGGTASVHIATDPKSDGIHTVIASVHNAAGGITAQAYDTYDCDGPEKKVVVHPAPTHTAPGTGTGTGTITPPRTGSAGLAADNGVSSLYLVLAGAVAFAVAGLVSIRFAKQS